MYEPKYDVMITVKSGVAGYKATVPCKRVSMNQAFLEAKRAAEDANYMYGKVIVESVHIDFKRID
jgi:hypothetical protein